MCRLFWSGHKNNCKMSCETNRFHPKTDPSDAKNALFVSKTNSIRNSCQTIELLKSKALQGQREAKYCEVDFLPTSRVWDFDCQKNENTTLDFSGQDTFSDFGHAAQWNCHELMIYFEFWSVSGDPHRPRYRSLTDSAHSLLVLKSWEHSMLDYVTHSACSRGDQNCERQNCPCPPLPDPPPQHKSRQCALFVGSQK